MCRPKCEGGVGLQSLRDMRVVAGMKLTWKFISQKTLWSEWIECRYLKGANFWVHRGNSNDSATFKTMLLHKQAVQWEVLISFKDGSNTNLWFDPWVKH